MSTAGPLVHQALIYESPEDLAAAVAPFLREGVERGDTVFVATAAANLPALRAEFGAHADGVGLQATEQWAPHPADRLAEVLRMVASLPPGRELRALGEPLWHGSPAVKREWARYESIINLALADARLRFICLYDGSHPEDVIGHACSTHPAVAVDGEGPHASDDFTDVESYVERLDRSAASPPAGETHDFRFDGDHHAFRAALARFAREAGLADDRVEDLVIAANEISSNAVLHGRPPIAARAWARDGEVVCQISDSGPGVHDPLAGWMLPDRPTPGGWGLALSRRLCDALEIVPTAKGTDIHLHVGLGKVRAGAFAQ